MGKKPLGMIMIEKGYIDETQLQKIIMIQRARARERAQHIREKRDDNLFGKLVLRFGYADEDEINECMRIQEKVEQELFMRLGEIMVRKGYLSTEQVEAILEYQKMKILTCPGCNTQYNVVMFKPGAKMKCYKCGKELVVPKKLVTVAAEDIDFPEVMDEMRERAAQADQADRADRGAEEQKNGPVTNAINIPGKKALKQTNKPSSKKQPRSRRATDTQK